MDDKALSRAQGGDAGMSYERLPRRLTKPTSATPPLAIPAIARVSRFV